jgi:hypothetical protein
MPLPGPLFTGIIQEAPGSFGRHVVDLGSQGVPLIGELSNGHLDCHR